jgi:Domain of unknown function (DU1801)
VAIKPENAKDPEDYLAQIDEPRRSDIEALDRLIRKEAPNLERHFAYGMLAYGAIQYRSKSGREGDWFVAALASQKRYISLYVSCTNEQGYLAEQYRDRLPKADIGKSCVRFKRLSDVDEGTLRELVREAAQIFERDPDFAVLT